MKADQHAVFRDLEILLDIVCALSDRQPIRFQRVFRRVTRGAAVRDECFALILRLTRKRRARHRENEHKQEYHRPSKHKDSSWNRKIWPSAPAGHPAVGWRKRGMG